MKTLRATFFLLFVGFGFVIAVGMGMMLFLQYRSYIRKSYSDVIENTAHTVDRLFPQIEDTDSLLAQGEAREESYFSLVRQINEINESFGFAFIYYIQYTGGNFRFVLDTDDISSFEDGTFFDEYWLKDYLDAPDEALYALTQNEFTITKEPYTDEWGTFISGFYPITNDAGAVTGVLGLDFDVSYVRNLEQKAVFAFTLSLAVVLMVAGLLSLRIAASITRPINEVAVAANTLAQMRFDIKTSKLRKNEIGVMQRALYAIRDTLRQTMGEINDEKLGKQLNISKNLNQIIEQSSEELRTISAGMDLLESKIREENEFVQETSISVTDISGSIETFKRAVDSQMESIASSSELIEQMVRDIHDIQAMVRKAQDITETLGESSKGGKKTLEQLTEDMALMTERSAALEQANGTIANIATQTNILAMNAAIEAAHAGESGKGFAVVSSEIRKLAVSSNKESESISIEIKNMAESIDKIRDVSSLTVESMNNIFMRLSEMNASFAVISNNIEIQAVKGGRILEDLKKIRTVADEVNSGSDSIQRGSTSIEKTVRDLQAASEEVGSSVSTAQKASKQIAVSFSMAKKLMDGTIIVRPEQNG
jgi:methyl-accepting chemotaxis protein